MQLDSIEPCVTEAPPLPPPPPPDPEELAAQPKRHWTPLGNSWCLVRTFGDAFFRFIVETGLWIVWASGRCGEDTAKTRMHRMCKATLAHMLKHPDWTRTCCLTTRSGSKGLKRDRCSSKCCFWNAPTAISQSRSTSLTNTRNIFVARTGSLIYEPANGFRTDPTCTSSRTRTCRTYLMRCSSHGKRFSTSLLVETEPFGILSKPSSAIRYKAPPKKRSSSFSTDLAAPGSPRCLKR